MPWYKAAIIGTGSEEDPFRTSLADMGVDHSASIPTDEYGNPLYDSAVAWVEDPSQLPDSMLESAEISAGLAEQLIQEQADPSK